MTWPCKLPLWPAALALLSGCTASAPLPPLPPAPRPLAQPLLSAADIRQAERHAYWLGYAAGRRYQKQQNTPDAPGPAAVPVAATPPAAATAAIPVAAAPALPAREPLQPMPPPVDSYVPKGPAQPVATPVN
jgi:hypothetical protein